MLLVGLVACGAGAPAAGELRTDREGLAARMALPADVTEVRWLTLPAHVGRNNTGRGDARVFAWVRTPGDESAWLQSTLGAPLGPRAQWVVDEVGNVLFTDVERAGLKHNDARKTWKLGCVRYPAIAAGLGEFRADVVLDCSDHLYVSLTAR